MKYSRNSFSRFVPILLVIVITVVAVAAVIAIGSSLLGGEKNDQAEQNVDIGRETLLSTDLDKSVRLTVRGPITAQENHRSYQVTIGPDFRTITTYEGYLGKQLGEKKLDNNTPAYEEFVYALDKRKMMNGTELSPEKNDLRGICATGKIYKFEVLNQGEPVKTLWTSDCGGSKGSAQANVQEIIDMFLKQIPGAKKIASEIGLTQEETFFRL